MEYINLVGAEAVATAGRQIKQAAEEINRAAQMQEQAFREFSQFLQKWITDFEEILCINRKNLE